MEQDGHAGNSLYKYIQLISYKGIRAIQWRKDWVFFSTNGDGAIGHPQAKT